MKSQTKPICAWCTPGAPGNHTICEYHKAQLLADYARDCDAQDVAHTFSDLERARAYRFPQPMSNELDVDGTRMDSLQAARGILAGVLIGAAILLTGILAMFAL